MLQQQNKKLNTLTIAPYHRNFAVRIDLSSSQLHQRVNLKEFPLQRALHRYIYMFISPVCIPYIEHLTHITHVPLCCNLVRTARQCYLRTAHVRVSFLFINCAAICAQRRRKCIAARRSSLMMIAPFAQNESRSGLMILLKNV